MSKNNWKEVLNTILRLVIAIASTLTATGTIN